MDLEKYGELINTPITDESILIQHFASKIAYFIIENDFGDGPTLEDLLNEMLECSKLIPAK